MTTGDSLMDVDVIASISFCHLHCTDTGLPVSQLMNCHSFHHGILCSATAVNHIQDVTAEQRGDPTEMPGETSPVTVPDCHTVLSSGHQTKESFWTREKYFGGQMGISALLIHQSN